MKVTGTSHLSADRPAVWRALNDPAVLVRTIPGCKRLEATGENTYKMTVAAGVGSIKGVYDGDVRLTDHEEPGSFRMHAQGAGAAGTIGAAVMVTLAEAADGGTELTYDADATVGGMIGGVGQRMLTGVSKKMAAEFFGNVDKLLASGGVGAAVPSSGLPEEEGAGNQARSARQPGPSTPAPSTSVHPAAGGAPTAGQVFTAPAAVGGAGGADTGFMVGVAVGAVAALAGAVVGGWLSRRRN